MIVLDVRAIKESPEPPPTIAVTLEWRNTSIVNIERNVDGWTYDVWIGGTKYPLGLHGLDLLIEQLQELRR